jgi:hypothetical protein
LIAKSLISKFKYLQMMSMILFSWLNTMFFVFTLVFPVKVAVGYVHVALVESQVLNDEQLQHPDLLSVASQLLRHTRAAAAEAAVCNAQV